MTYTVQSRHHEILVVDPAGHTPETDCFNNISRLSALRTSYHLPGLCGLSTLRHADLRQKSGKLRISGIIVLGSATSVHDRLPWQTDLVNWIQPHIAGGVPVFGFCFGHQMIADMHGGKVDFLRPDQEKLKGFYHVDIKYSRIFPEGRKSLLRSHREAVMTIPDGFHLMATSSDVAIDGLEHDNLPVWSLQTHPEATSAFLVNQGIDSPELLPENEPEKSKRMADGWTLVSAFLNHCKDN